MSLLNSASLVVTPNGYKEGTLYSVIPNTTLGDMTVVRATTATRVNSAGLIESVANNVPRLDYLNASCPTILIESQRTNLNTYSNNFSSVGGWGGVGVSVTANYGIAPDGTNTSSQIVFTGSSQILGKTVGGLIGNTGVFSLWIKGTAGQTIALTYGGNTDKLVTLGNGWNRFTTDGNVGTLNQIFINTFLSATARTFEVWGGQVELGTYPTSYIPTTSAAVTRNADVISKTGISALIGQTEGVMFVDYNYEAKPDISGSMPIVIVSGSNEAYIFITTSGALRFELYDAGVLQSLITGTIGTVGRKKIAFAYKANDFAAYMNGVQIGTDISGTVGSMSNLYVGSYYTANYNANGGINQAVLFPTRLTNAELAQLTTI